MDMKLEYNYHKDYDNQLKIEICISESLSQGEYKKVVDAIEVIRGIINPILDRYTPEKEEDED